MKADAQLSERLKQAMLMDGRLSSQPIDVNAVGGVVTLSGAVQSFGRKRAALEIAGAIEGVRAVCDEIEVVPAHPHSDQELAEQVRRALEACGGVVKAAITVEIASGVVTLRGNVAAAHERLIAEDVAIAVPGIRHSYNLLFVNDREQLEDASRARDLEMAIGLTGGLRDAAIRAAVANGAAVLSGAVSHPWQRRLAESVAGQFRFVSVRNEIVIQGTGAASPLGDA